MSRPPKLIALVSIHGLIRAQNLELGSNADTGGQTKYVVELAEELGECPEVERVDLLTRLIDDPDYSRDYAQPFEELGPNAQIVRLSCGPQGYVRKELLYPHLDDYLQRAIRFYEEGGRPPDVVHGHYADGAYVAQRLAEHFRAPFLFTGHSLGRNKVEALAKAGMSRDEMREQYAIDTRIAIEEEALREADIVIASTEYEIETGYDLYDARPQANFRVVPPGIDLERFYPYYYDDDPNFVRDEEQLQAAHRMRREIARFVTQPEKPVILAISRPDRRKNIASLIEAYGSDPELQSLANLAIFAGVRKDIETMDDNEREVLTELLLLMDRYDLYGRLALPKKHYPETDIPELYRIAAHRRGVFINPALVENFGITLIEAAASGLPIVSTDFGGPNDIVKNCNNGILVDSNDQEEVRRALKTLLIDEELWERSSQNGVLGAQEHYAWSAHCATYLEPQPAATDAS
ncbi:MAG: glycosyltransferase [Trueperaceae bacterium]|jgi:sucrose-phosphate synthase